MRHRAVVLLVSVLAAGATTRAMAAQPTGDPKRGAALFRQCAACHTVEPGLHLTGPSLARIWGRRAGTVEGFTRYSDAFKSADLAWTAEALDRWLEDPAKVIPNNLMTFPGMEDLQARADLVAYLQAVAAGQAPDGTARAQQRTDLKTLGKERRVRAIRYCGDAYHVSTEAGQTRPFWEFNLRFKTDSSPTGPAPGSPVLLPAGMMGDRAFVVFSSPEEISRMIERKC
jgi:cytochrome c